MQKTRSEKCSEVVALRKERLDQMVVAQADPVRLNAARELWLLALRQLERAVEAEAAAAGEQQAHAAAERLKVLRSPPDLQALVVAYGTWDKITPQAWATFEERMTQWREQLLAGAFEREAKRSRM